MQFQTACTLDLANHSYHICGDQRAASQVPDTAYQNGLIHCPQDQFWLVILEQLSEQLQNT